MKSLTIIISATLLFAALKTSAQTEKAYYDTVKVVCNNGVYVQMATYNHMVLKKDTTLAGIINGLQSNLRKIRNNIPAEGRYSILYIPGTSIVIEKLPALSKYTVSEDAVVPNLQTNECELHTADYHISFKFNNLDDILDGSITACIRETIAQLPERSRQANDYSYRFADGKGTLEELPSGKNNGHDMLVIAGSVGAGIVKNSLLTDIGLEVGVSFNKKGILRNGYYVSNNLTYVFNETGDKFYINSFLNVGYRYNFSNDPEKKNWIGPELGFPVYKEGDFFRNNLFRAGIKWELGRSVWVAGQLYVNEGFKSAYPGLRIGFGF